MARTPFKLKSGNSSAFKEMGSTSMSFQDLANKAKDDANKLHDNLQVIGTNVQEFKQKRKDVVESKRLASEDKKTNFQRRADERKEQRKTGESKFQADVRKRKEASKAKTKYTTSGTAKDTIDPKRQSAAVGPQSEATAKLNKESFPTKGPVKPTTEITPEWIMDKAKSSWRYKKNQDGTYTTKKGDEGEEIKVGEGDKGFEAISGVFKKKSPYQLGISKNYTKRPKGSRGYRMNKNN